MTRLRILVLGPVLLRRPDGATVGIGGRNARAALVSLVLDVGRAVPVDRMVFDIWGDDAPPTAERIVRSIISRLRHELGAEHVKGVDHSYVLLMDPNGIDAVHFERIIDEASHCLAAGRVAEALRAARSALRLWRGDPFGDLADAPFTEIEVRRLLELRARVTELHFEAELALGEAGAMIGRLRAEAEVHRYRERLWALLVTALAREGRRAEAIRTFDEAAAILSEVGLEPCAELKALAAQVAVEDPGVQAHLILPSPP